MIDFLMTARKKIILFVILSVVLVFGSNYLLSLKSNRSWTELRPATLIGMAMFMIISCIPFTYLGYIMISTWVPAILSIGIGVLLILIHVQGVIDYQGSNSQ